MLPFTVRYFAHRGLHGDRRIAPENSLEAFRRAVEAGFGMELDVQLTKDRQVVVFHDDTLERVCGRPGSAEDYTYEELQRFPLYDSDQRIPLLTDVLQVVQGRTPLIVELKAVENRFSRDLCQRTASILDAYEGPYCIESFHPMIVYWFKSNRPQVYRGQLCTDFYRTHARGERWQFTLMQFMIHNFLTCPDFIAYDHRYKHHLPFRLWKRKITPVAWTVRSREELEACRDDFEYFILERTASD